MATKEISSQESRIVFTSGDHPFTIRDLINAAIFRGELAPVWENLLQMVAAEGQAEERDLELNDDPIDSAAEAFRYQHDLITAEETEQWLSQRGLTLNDFSDYFVRHYWGDTIGGEIEAEAPGYFSAPNELRQLLVSELILSGEIERLADRLSRRVASHAAIESEIGSATLAAERDDFFKRHELTESDLSRWLEQIDRDADWLDKAIAMEVAHRQRSENLLTQTAREREISALRLPLTRFEVETIEFDSPDAAREATLCVREDGMSMEEVAAEGRYPYRSTALLLEDIPEDLQQKFLSVSAGDILEPIPFGEGFHLCRIVGKAEPDLKDPVVKSRAEQRILDRHFAELTSRHIEWRNLSSAAQ